jgi:ligand-binding sensor domain-containing protein/signal transduction histidine kinase
MRLSRSVPSLTLTIAVVCGAPATAAPDGSAAAREYLVDVWDTDRGLPNSFVTSITQTPDGYLWVATQNGLLRFDGIRFTAFDPDNTPELKHARIEHVFVDAAGTLWVNTYDGSLTSLRDGVFRHEWGGSGAIEFEAFLAESRVDRATFVLDRGAVIRRSFTSAIREWDILRPPGSELVPLFARDASGVVWIRSIDHRLWRLSDRALEPAATDGLVGTRIQCIASDASGRIWVGTDAEVAVFEDGRFRTMTPTNGESRLDVSLLFFTRDGGHWVVANGRARKARDRAWIWADEIGRGLTGPYRQSINALEDRGGGVWFTHYGKGVLHVRSTGRARWITSADGLPGNRVKFGLEDREGNIWLAVDRGGLVRLRDAQFHVLTITDGHSRSPVSSIAEGADGAIWIGSMGGGLQRYRGDAITRFALPTATAGGFVFSVFPDERGRVWLSADEEDLFYFDGEAVRRSPASVHGIKTMLVDRREGLWLGTKTGLFLLTDDGMRAFGPEDGFERRDVRALASGSDGSVWIGSGDGTIYQWQNGRLTPLRAGDAGTRYPVWSLLAGDERTVWAGTFRGGLLRLRGGRFTRYTTKEGLPSNIICQVLEDGSGHLWIGSSNGIFRVAKNSIDAFDRRAVASIPVVNYGRSDGLPTLECSGNYQPSAWRARNGRLWFATSKGIVSIDPNLPTLDAPPPRVILEELRLDQETVALRAASNDAANGSAEPALQIASGPHRLEFRYTGVSFSTPDQVRFRYRLEGLEQGWIDAGIQRSAQYSYLPPGDYRFRVAASHGDGRWSTDEVALAFRVLPHFSETWWFRASVMLAALVFVAGTVRYVSMKRLRRKLDRLEFQQALERDRGRIARDIHDDLGAGLTQITLLSELARREPVAEMHGHLGQISDTARELTLAVDEIVWAVNSRHDTLEGLVTYVCQFAQQYLTVAGIQCRLDMPAQFQPLRLTSDVRHNVFLAVKEVLNNIVKHAHAREVWLRLAQDRAGFTLVVEDDGQGFARGRDFGQGLHNLQDRLSGIGGRCHVASEPGSGTRVELRVETH